MWDEADREKPPVTSRWMVMVMLMGNRARLYPKPAVSRRTGRKIKAFGFL